eukprot:GHVR01047019.1.p1 GENE.GHVR01047019.1~~GHVR01047019.1.p1  ORF type:complete len:105 (-),score=4.52 GHVR01047019.1:308-622(-)
MGLDSYGEIPDYSQYSKEQLELAALKTLARSQHKKKKVILTFFLDKILRKNTHSKEESLRVTASSVAPLLQNGGSYSIVLEIHLGSCPNGRMHCINDKTTNSIT